MRARPPTLEQEELRGISRTVAEIHWLLLILVLLYVIYGEVDGEARAAVIAASFFYGALIMLFRYTGLYRQESHWKIALETWGMIAFITWVCSFTGGLASPLLNTYLLPVITSALALGKATTLIEVALIASCQVFLSGSIPLDRVLSLGFVGGFAAQLAPVLLVAYIVTMFSADIRFGLSKAKLLAETDGLTGLLNQRGFALATDRLFAQAARHSRQASILMIDSDNLKPVNDNHGHEAGNLLLKQMAKAIRAELRDTDVPARYGGDEFVVFLSETPLKGALVVAERIRSTMANTPIALDGKEVGCTVSIGVAGFPEDGLTIDAVASRADRALYQAKNSGRNRVVKFQAN